MVMVCMIFQKSIFFPILQNPWPMCIKYHWNRVKAYLQPVLVLVAFTKALLDKTTMYLYNQGPQIAKQFFISYQYFEGNGSDALS